MVAKQLALIDQSRAQENICLENVSQEETNMEGLCLVGRQCLVSVSEADMAQLVLKYSCIHLQSLSFYRKKKSCSYCDA
jgi:hypothetical protein